MAIEKPAGAKTMLIFIWFYKGKMMEHEHCKHNARSRYTHGFHCRDCNTFFGINSPTYRSGELLSEIWMVLHNINALRQRSGISKDKEVASMVKEIGIGVRHDDYEDIISRAEIIMKKHDKNSESATMVLG